MATRIRVLAATVSGLLGLACGGCGGGGSVSGGSATTQSAFINQYCDLYRPCCAATGRPVDGAACRLALTTAPALFLAATYDEAAGETCLGALREAATHPGFCADTVDRPIACDPALGQTGTAAPGASCSVDNDCAPSPDGRVACFHPNITSFCQIQIRGHAGDGPCVSTVGIGSSSYAGPLHQDGLARAYACYLSDGLFCDQGTGCAALRAPGGACCARTASWKTTRSFWTWWCAATRSCGAPPADVRAGAARAMLRMIELA